MAEDGSWENILKYGLLSTSAMLDLCNINGSVRDQIETEWRSSSVKLSCGILGDIVIRDQIPMSPDNLSKCLLDGMTTSEWYKLINGKVFFWTSWRGLTKLISAMQYRKKPHIVITIDTRSLIDECSDSINVTNINSGSTIYDPNRYDRPYPRGMSTFQKLKDNNFSYLQELTVDKEVKELTNKTIVVERWISRWKGYDNPSLENLGKVWP